MDNIYCIYKLTCSVTGKSYIGQTKNYNQRLKKHRSGNSHGSGASAIGPAIKKYGFECFTHELLVEGLILEEANDWEPIYIELYDTICPRGYNLRGGGHNGEHHIETKRKISERLKGRIAHNKDVASKSKGKTYEEIYGHQRAASIKQKLSSGHIGLKSSLEKRENMSRSLKGRTLSESHRRKISNALKGRVPWNKGPINLSGKIDLS